MGFLLIGATAGWAAQVRTKLGAAVLADGPIGSNRHEANAAIT
jgi:hypothetical protein